MADNSRVRNTIYNFISSMGGQLLTILMNFVIRTVFIHTLGKSYLGINGLFSNILSMLSLAEMGVGNAILFKLYEPIAHNDQKRITSLISFYKVVYRYIGLAVALIGACLIPFLPNLIRDYEKLSTLNLNVVLIYLLYLLNSISSYFFFAYKSAIVKADQREYICNMIGYAVTMLSGITQILCMVFFKSFELYVMILVGGTVLQNIFIAVYANKRYSYIGDKRAQKLEKTEIKDIFKDCGAIFVYKVNNVVLKSTDNIILSAFLGLDSVALYSNYYIFYTTITNLFSRIFNSVGHSIGNLHTTGNKRQEYRVFEVTMLIASILGGTAFVGIFVVGNELISTWIGNEWVLLQPFAFLMGLELYTSSVKHAMSKYRNAYGLFRQGWARPLAGMVINLVVSLALVGRVGISGVLIGTIVADWTTCIWYDPLIIHKFGFEKEFPLSVYFLKFAKYFITACVVGLVDYYICSHFLTGMGWISVIIHALICAVTTPAALLAVSAGSQEAKYVWKLAMKQVKGIKKKLLRK